MVIDCEGPASCIYHNSQGDMYYERITDLGHDYLIVTSITDEGIEVKTLYIIVPFDIEIVKYYDPLIISPALVGLE